MKRNSLLFVLVLACALCSCATTGSAEYSAYLQANAAQAQQQAVALSSITDAAAGCTDDSCRVAVAAIAALAQTGKQGNTIAPFQPQQSTAAKIGLALVGQLSPIASAAVNWHQSDNSRDVQIAQYSFLEGVIANAGEALEGLAPSISVGGDYVTGGQIGDSNGDGSAMNGSQVGDNVGRDQTGGDHIDHSGDVGGDWRDTSDGPIDNSDPGDDCTGTSCNPSDGG